MDVVGSLKYNLGFFYNVIKIIYDCEEVEGYFSKKIVEVKVLSYGYCYNIDWC